jgi:hypothetical protein
MGPAAKRGRIRHAVRVFERRRGLLPGTMLHKVPPQCLAAGQQAIVCVRKRKQRKEGEGLPAARTTTAANPDPVMMLIVRLLAAPSMTDDRIARTNRAPPQDDFGAARGPIRFELVQRATKWDKQNRT